MIVHIKNKVEEKDSSRNQSWIYLDNWHCGSPSYAMSEHLSNFGANVACYGQTSELNDACYKHDQCYTNLQGQYSCDMQFCRNIKEIIDGNWRIYINPWCSGIHMNFCAAVRLFGESAYAKVLEGIFSYVTNHFSTETRSKCLTCKGSNCSKLCDRCDISNNKPGCTVSNYCSLIKIYL